ncbi:hypothetical protein JCGZ_14252 [Jatropha curcas]|uniref:cyclic pyranopterin monophosphate synthase n=1 Tax=Jatropha curcas TaxID=180498 RepID=A0A067JWY2_JATCU|nr:cyclic pyranopterin monophosphate synthase, mitochondrial [Jatropha curcas]KDP28481.1 hypothetical protein JCGZ_14252 [Jatropha curcas]
MFLRRAAIVLPCSRKFLSAKYTHDLASSITELNKEMESVFGQPPSGGISGSTKKDYMPQEPQFTQGPVSSIRNNNLVESQSAIQRMNHNALGLTHIGSRGEAQMVDVSPKENSKRTAIASCKVILGKEVFDMVLANRMAKGDVLTVAKIAGINGAKHTSSLIPLCHNIALTHVRVDLMLNPDNYSVVIEGEAACTGKTGVEMEALTAVTTAGLTVYDMCKAASKEIQIADVRLEHKTGGKSGDWTRNITIPMTNAPTKTSAEIKKVSKIDRRIRRFIQLTLGPFETPKLSGDVVTQSIASCFNCQSIVVATEKDAEGRFCFRIGILTVDATQRTAEKILKSKFTEFKISQFSLKFHNGWAKICELITQHDKSPSVWGKYSVEQILELARASRLHRKIQVARSSS